MNATQTLLHHLCKGGHYVFSFNFAAKCRILREIGVDWKARDHKDQTAVDIIESRLTHHWDIKLSEAKDLVKSLENVPMQLNQLIL